MDPQAESVNGPDDVALELNRPQRESIATGGTTLLTGPAGTGKSTALAHRLRALLEAGESAYTILVLIAESEQQQEFLDPLRRAGLGPFADLKILTFYQLAREMTILFWPLIARPAGFERPHQPPTVLNYDLAQLLMWEIVDPMLEGGAFVDLRLRPQQIVSQILDTLNRAAFNGLTVEEATARQIESWTGEPGRIRHLQAAAEAANRFRQLCQQRSLLDLSLTVDLFHRHLLGHPEFHRYFQERYRHLLVDNVEEQTPVGQMFIADLMELSQTTTIVVDTGGGYKRFLAADPGGAGQFRSRCRRVIEFKDSFTSREPLSHLANLVDNYLTGGHRPTAAASEAILATITGRYRREMVERLASRVAEMIHRDGIPPSEIALVTPYLDGALRYTLEQTFQQHQIPYAILRRRSSPREEPRIRAWLTWLTLAHPDWEIPLSPFDVAEALTLTVAELDPARAALVTRHVYHEESRSLLPVEAIPDAIQQRVGPEVIDQLAQLADWLEAHTDQPPDTFLQALFHDLLAQPAFQSEPDAGGAALSEWLVETAGRLHRAAKAIGWQTPREVGKTFIDGIYHGLVSADPPELSTPPEIAGLTIATVYGYLLVGRVARVQIWLETAATGWWDLPRQPLSNAFVLAPGREPGQPWTAEEAFAVRNELLSGIIRGLTSRCRDGIILADSAMDRRGRRQEGRLWSALQKVRER